MSLLLAGLAVLVGSGLLALGAGRWPRLALAIGALGAVVGAILGLVPVARVLAGGAPAALDAGFSLPVGRVLLGLDPLSAFFLVPLLGLSIPAALYGCSYLAGHPRARSLGAFACSFNALLASMVLVLVARHAVLFLVAWELMTVSSYLLVVFEHEQAEVRRAGFVYLIAGHVGVMCLVVLFLLLGQAAGGLDLGRFARLDLSGGHALGLFALALVGFGVKAGVVPLHVWLPEAHAAAPSHVSALMSAVLITLGLYGILRTLTWLDPGALGAIALIAAGLIGAIYGISMALAQRDLKRVLAYSSVENMGLILLGVGLGLWARSRQRPDIALLATGGALLHVWNHALGKGLLFLSAGSVVHGAGGRDLEQMGGLMRRMPKTGALMVLGAVALGGLPPLNGFVSEWMLYLGLGRMGLTQHDVGGLAALLVFGVLALVGGLAAACFVRLVGIALLGTPRGQGARHAHESPAGMLPPMAALAAGCVAMALLPGPVLRALRPVLAELLGLELASADVGPALATLASVNAGLWIAILAVAVVLHGRLRASAADDTWGCGYPGGTARIQYTARSFSELIASHLLPGWLRARVAVLPPAGVFPGPSTFSTDAADPATRDAYEPFLARWATRFARLRWIQQGRTHAYVSYILFVVLVAMAWASLHAWMSS